MKKYSALNLLLSVNSVFSMDRAQESVLQKPAPLAADPSREDFKNKLNALIKPAAGKPHAPKVTNKPAAPAAAGEENVAAGVRQENAPTAQAPKPEAPKRPAFKPALPPLPAKAEAKPVAVNENSETRTMAALEAKPVEVGNGEANPPAIIDGKPVAVIQGTNSTREWMQGLGFAIMALGSLWAYTRSGQSGAEKQ